MLRKVEITAWSRFGCVQLLVCGLLVWLTAPVTPDQATHDALWEQRRAMHPELGQRMRATFAKRAAEMAAGEDPALPTLEDLGLDPAAFQLQVNRGAWRSDHSRDESLVLVMVEHARAPYRGKDLNSLRADGRVVGHADNLFIRTRQLWHYVGGFLLSLSVVSVLTIVPSLRHGWRSRSWLRVPGEIIASGVGQAFHVPGEDGGWRYPLAIEYRYWHAGEEHIGTQVATVEAMYASADEAAEAATAYPVGRAVQVSVPPAFEDGPALLEPGVEAGHWVALAVSIGIPLMIWLLALFLRAYA